MKFGVPLLVGGASATGVAAFGGYYFLKSGGSTIREKLRGQKFIKFSDSAQWSEEFKSDSENIRSSIKELKDATDENGGAKLKNWCESQMELDFKKNSQSLELVGKYCLIRDLASQLSRKGKTLLNSSSSATDWSNTYDKRQQKKTPRTEVGWKDQWAEDPNTQKTIDLENVKTWCLDTSKEEFLAIDKDSKYDKLLRWCTKEAASEQ